MNILFLCDEYPPCKNGGIGTVTRILAREIVRNGHHVIVCGFYPYYRTSLPYENDKGVKVYRQFYGNKLLLKFSRNKYFGSFINIENQFNKYVRFIKKIIDKNHIELIEIPDFNEVFRYSGPRNLKFPDFGIPTVVKLHGTYSFIAQIAEGMPVEKCLYRKEKTLIHNATKLLAVSNFAKNMTANIFNYTNDIQVINNGIDFDCSSVYKEDLTIKSVIFAGKLSKEKGILSLVSAWENVIDEIPSAKLRLYGKGEKRIIEYINKINSHKLYKSIELKGFVSSKMLGEIYTTASCAIFPSYIETFGMAPLESMAVGCPTIYTRRASGEELIENRINGLLVDPDNKQEIADAIIFMLNNRTYARKIGENGAKTIRDKFDIKIIGIKHLDLYSDLIKNGR